MLKIGIIVGTTRPGRKAPAVAEWLLEHARERKQARFEIVDIESYDLPLLDEPVPPSQNKYTKDHTKRWSEKIAGLDGFIFIVPEYNHSMPGALKNAVDFLYHEWTNKAAGFVSYGATGGVRGVEHMRGILGEVQIADVRAHVTLSLFTDFENFTTFKPSPSATMHLPALLDQLIAWGEALKGVREKQAAAEAA
jgi:NAD(P)H-dependent FMN reductase